MLNKIDKIRNIGIIAHVDAGKTTVSERILFYTNSISRMGEVHEGASTLDFTPEEQEHGITISSASSTCYWRDHQLNLIDTPGHVDFTIEVERSLRVLDSAIGVFCAVAGVEPQSETVWRQSEKFNLPKLAIVNKIDREGANYAGVLKAMKHKLQAMPLPITVPLGEGENFESIANIIDLERLDFDPNTQGKIIKVSPLNAQELEAINEWREYFFEVLSEHDDEILGAYLLGEQLPKPVILAAIRKATLECKIVPTYASAALQNKGVQPLLDGIIDFLPAPNNKIIKVISSSVANKFQDDYEIQSVSAEPLAALAFKVVVVKNKKFVFLRIYSGKLLLGQTYYNPNSNIYETVESIYRVFADSYDELDFAEAGDIVAVNGLENTQTGDSFCDSQRVVLLEKITIHQPVISIAIEVKKIEDLASLNLALRRLCLEDPTLVLNQEESTGQNFLAGMGELHLEIAMEKIKRETGLELATGNPMVVLHETIINEVQGQGTFEHLIEEENNFAHLELEIKPRARAEGNIINFTCDTIIQTPKMQNSAENNFSNAQTQACPETWAEAQTEAWTTIVEAEILSVLQCGALGYPVQDLEITITKFELKNNQLSKVACQMAASFAMRAAFAKVESIILEPIMRLEISTPTNFVGSVVSLLGVRSAKLDCINDDEQTLEQKSILAFAKMKDIFGFSTDLRSVSQGRAAMVIKFDRFDSKL